jgi:hypothetical protein
VTNVADWVENNVTEQVGATLCASKPVVACTTNARVCFAMDIVECLDHIESRDAAIYRGGASTDDGAVL